jgi:acyl carrier protein
MIRFENVSKKINPDIKERNSMEFQKLKEIIVDVLNVNEEDVTMETTFVDDLGADSLDVFQIIMGIEETFDIEIENEDAEKIVTVGDAVEQIKNAMN